jgi:hypothetical protein
VRKARPLYGQVIRYTVAVESHPIVTLASSAGCTMHVRLSSVGFQQCSPFLHVSVTHYCKNAPYAQRTKSSYEDSLTISTRHF